MHIAVRKTLAAINLQESRIRIKTTIRKMIKSTSRIKSRI